MPNPLDLKYKKISETYHRVVQVSSGKFYDGDGNELLILNQVAKNYRYIQVNPANIWNVTHNLGYKPNCVITDTAGDVIYGDIKHTSTNELTVTFLSAFSGEATCS